jgi:transcriptional repressor NrdR
VELDLNVIKKDGRREKFSRDKLYQGVAKNLEKRPFTSEQIEEIVGDVEASIYRCAKDKDIKSSQDRRACYEQIKKS